MSSAPTLRILSLGAGVQSTTLALKSCRGELPTLDAAIFADTGWEPRAVYEHLAWLKPELERSGIPVHIVKAGNIRTDSLASAANVRVADDESGRRWAAMPFYTKMPGDVREGMVRRQCTKEYKLEPIKKQVRTLLGLKPRQRIPKDTLVEQWIGISRDEVRRVRLSQDRWVELVYPLIGLPTRPGEWCDPPMSREDCKRWLREHYPDRQVPRSACVGCPFRSNAEWRHLRDTSPDEWADAVMFDAAIRRRDEMDASVYLHRSCVPLGDARIDDDDPAQMAFECMGNCHT